MRQEPRARSAMNEPMKSKLPSPEERLELILLGLARRVPVRELCRQAGVSRELFYRWLRAVRLAGLRALESKAPGPKAIPSGAGGVPGPQAEGSGGAHGEGAPEPAQGAGPLAPSGGDSKAYNPPQCLGPGGGAAV